MLVAPLIPAGRPSIESFAVPMGGAFSKKFASDESKLRTFMQNNNDQSSGNGVEPGMNEVLARNIRTLLEKRQVEECKASIEQKLADAITRFAGSMPFVYLHAVFFGLWILINLGWMDRFGLRPFDPSFVVLAMIASVEAIFLSTFILISQNRMNATSERRADLDLHISLLAEHEITKILQLVSQLAERIGICEGNSPELAELKRDVAPEKVLDKIEQRSPQSR
jgi:uncharacterized membrane protein